MSSQKLNTVHSDTNCCNWYKMFIELRLLQYYHNTVSKDGKVFIRDKEKVTEFFCFFCFFILFFYSVNDGQTSCTTKDNPIALWLILRVSKNKNKKQNKTKKQPTTKQQNTTASKTKVQKAIQLLKYKNKNKTKQQQQNIIVYLNNA